MSSESPSLEDSVGLTRTCNGEGCEQAIDMKGEVSEGTTLESLGTPVSNATEFYCLGCTRQIIDDYATNKLSEVYPLRSSDRGRYVLPGNSRKDEDAEDGSWPVSAHLVRFVWPQQTGQLLLPIKDRHAFGLSKSGYGIRSEGEIMDFKSHAKAPWTEKRWFVKVGETLDRLYEVSVLGSLVVETEGDTYVLPEALDVELRKTAASDSSFRVSTRGDLRRATLKELKHEKRDDAPQKRYRFIIASGESEE